MSELLKRYLFQMIPLMLACFSVISVTLLCESKWVAVLIQAPIWLILFWWWHMQEVYAMEPRFRYRQEELDQYKLDGYKKNN